ncbi:MAG: zinc finger domain-containing protein [Candidatus Anstonellales archaeon]
MKRCISCGKTTINFVSFPCPECGKDIIRCKDCRLNKVIYNHSCGFVGP